MSPVSRVSPVAVPAKQPKALAAPKPGLKYGMQGPEVLQLQEALVKLGYMTKAELATGPGIFGPRTWRALAHFKGAHGLKNIGVYGQKAADALARALAGQPGVVKQDVVRPKPPDITPPPLPKPAPVKPVDVGPIKDLTWDKAAAIIRAHGGEVNPGGRPTVLAVRTGETGSATYKDAFVVLKPGGKMAVFSATTRPTRLGDYGEAMVLAGNYQVTPRWRDGKYNNDAFILRNDNGGMTVDVARDANGDGRYSQRELDAGYTSDLIRIHRAGANTTASSGCFNVQDFDGFLKFLGGRDTRYNLTLVEA